jgi:DHA2 family multidrug resistance protein
MNVARNLGGSIGISLANVEITQRSQLHQSRLVENTIPSSPVFQSTLHDLSQYFISHGAAPGAANSAAMGFMGHMIQTQATIMAYIDVFHLCSVVAALMIPIVLIMVRRVQIRSGAAPAGH